MSSKARLGTLVILLATALWAIAGCTSNQAFLTPERLSRGMIVILPGIEGESPLNHSIRRGLEKGGVQCAIPIYSWGIPIPVAGMILNQTNSIGNRMAGVRVAQMITQYQDSHPGAPVYIIGHSGGGGVAVFAAEAMPPGRNINGLVLLSASISSNYNLNKALSNTQGGLVNFYNKSDAAILGIGTALLGNVDGGHGASAGLTGFDNNGYNKLFQVPMSSVSKGFGDPHSASTRPEFIANHVANWVLSSNWPPGSSNLLSAARIRR